MWNKDLKMEKEKTAIDIVKEILPADKLQIFEAAVKKLVETKVCEQVNELTALKEQELQEKYDTLSEEYISSEIEKREKLIQASLAESYDKKMNALDEKLALKVETFLDSEISEQISDKMLEQVAINETLKPVVEGIRKVFETNHLVLESTASDKIAKLQDTITELKKELANLTKEKLQLESDLHKTAKYLLFSEKTKYLTESEAKSTIKMFIDRSFEDVSKNIDGYITLLKEGKKKPKPTTKPKMDAMITENDEIVVEQKTVPESQGSQIEDVANAWFERYNN